MKVNITHAYENVYTFPEFSWRIRITCDAFARKSSDTLIFAQFRAKREREKEKKNIRRTPRGLIIRVDFGPGLVSADRLAGIFVARRLAFENVTPPLRHAVGCAIYKFPWRESANRGSIKWQFSGRSSRSSRGDDREALERWDSGKIRLTNDF